MASQLAGKRSIMAKVSFSKKYNTKKLFDIDTSEFDYKKLEELYDEQEVDEGTGELTEETFVVHGIYINTKSLYEVSPVAALDDCYVNLPAHVLDSCKDMIKDPVAVRAINEGHLGFRIEKYHQKRYDKDCYSVEWVDL